MSSRLELVDPLRYAGWDDLVLASPEHSIFHTSCWARVLRDSYGYRPCYLAGIEGRRLSVLVPLMEVRSFLTGRRGISLPFTDYCDPILDDDSRWPDILERLRFHGKNAGWRYLELRGGRGQLDQVPCSTRYHRHDLDLSGGTGRIYERVKSSVRRNIRKAEREGIVIRKSGGSEAISSYYELHCLTRKKHGLPPQPVKFFLNLYGHLIKKDQGQVLLAQHRGRTIAGAIFLHFGREATYKYGASDERYLHIRPNDLLIWAAIEGYAVAGYKSFSFGRTDLHDHGLLRFKRGWGAEETTVVYHRYDLRRDAFISGSQDGRSRVPELIGALPVPVLKLAGSLLYRHMG